MQVDLLVVNYNTKDKLERLLQTLNSDYQSDVWNLYVADNGSEDGSYQFLVENADKYRIQTVMRNPNVGYSEAVNNLSTLCNSEILCAVNADTAFDTNHVARAAETFQQRPKQAIMGPKQVNEEGLIKHGGIFWTGIKTQNPVHRGWNVPDPEDEKVKDVRQCWTVSGSLYYVRRSAWDVMTNHAQYRSLFPRLTGAMLPTFMYYEETFVSIFAAHLGYEVWYDGSIPTAIHSWHASNTPGDNTRYFHASRELYRQVANTMGIPHEIL